MRLKFLITVLILLLGGALLYQGGIVRDFYQQDKNEANQEIPESSQTNLDESRNKEEKLLEVPKQLPSLSEAPPTKPIEIDVEVSLPSPLRAPQKEESATSLLTRLGIILQTNLQRQQNGLGFLASNSVLDETATKKANDMCTNQYFAHISPSGVNVKSLAEATGYEFILIGENLALGNFSNDEEVVRAWMASPGHRANILNPRFGEIGIGLSSCNFEGRFAWLVVQHFGKPLADCRKPDGALKDGIENNKAQLSRSRSSILSLRKEIETSDPETDPNYNQKVDSYNSLVREYNALIKETVELVDQYNSQVDSFNECATS